MTLDKKVAIITGAGSGIGKATALLFAEQGAHVVIADLNEENGRKTEEEIVAQGNSAKFIKTNVTSTADIKNLVDQTMELFGSIDILYNNAGIPQSWQPAENLSEEFLDATLAVNVKAPFVLSQHVIPIMKKQKSGRILFTASMTGIRPMAGTNFYAVSKGAIVTMTQALAIELAEFNIQVNSVAPVAVETPMLDTFVVGEDKVEGRKQLVKRFPAGRLVRTEEVAKACLYLVSGDADMITGSVLKLDGGRGI